MASRYKHGDIETVASSWLSLASALWCYMTPAARRRGGALEAERL